MHSFSCPLCTLPLPPHPTKRPPLLKLPSALPATLCLAYSPQRRPPCLSVLAVLRLAPLYKSNFRNPWTGSPSYAHPPAPPSPHALSRLFASSWVPHATDHVPSIYIDTQLGPRGTYLYNGSRINFARGTGTSSISSPYIYHQFPVNPSSHPSRLATQRDQPHFIS